MNNYQNALRFKKARTYAYSLFKLGWCNYNLGKFQTALAFWKKTVDESNKGGKRTLALKEEALRDMVFVFAELRQVEPAIAYYQRHGGQKYIGKFLILLSQTFADQGQYAQAIKTLKRFQQVAPTAEEGPDTQKEIVNLNYELGRMSVVWQELEAFPKLYGPSSRWGGAMQASNKKLYLEVQQMIKDQILYYSKVVHKRAQSDDNRAGYAEAMKGYKLFLRSYPRSREVAEIKFNMADIEYFSKRYAEAGKLYFEICLMGKDKALIYDAKTGKPTNIHKQAAEYMLDAYSQLFQPEYNVITKSVPDYSKNRPPQALSTNAKLFIKACANYTKFYPGDKVPVKKCDVFITKIYYHTNNKEMSKKYLWLLAKKYPGTAEGNEAVNNLVPLYKGDDKALLAVTSQLLKIPAYQKGKIGQNLQQLQKDISRKELQNMKDRGKRAVAYEEEYKKNPRDPEADKLIYNAAIDYLSVGNIGKASAAYAVVISKHPKSEGAQDAMLQLAKLNEQRVNLGPAAAYYRKYADTYPKDKFALGALAKSCELESAIEKPSAVATCLNFGKFDEQGAKLAFGRMIRSAFSARQASRLDGLVKTFLGRFRVSPAERIEVLSYIYDVSDGSGGGAATAAEQILGAFKAAGGNIEGEPLAAVGKIIFRRVNDEMPKYLKYKLNGGTVDALAASIQQKTAALQRLTAAYQQVLATADPFWGVAALYQSGFAFEQFYNDLKDPPAIKGAKIEDVRKELSGQANEALAGAKNYYSKAMDLVGKAFVYNDWAANVISGMNRLNGVPVMYDDLIVTPDFIGADVPTSVASSVKGGGD